MRVSHVFPVLLAALPLLACSKKDAAKCQQAQSTIRDALNKEDFTIARQWRDYGYKYCDDDGSMATIDSEIKSKEEAVQKAKAEKEAKKKNAVQLAKLVAGLAGQGKADARTVAKSAKCPEEEDDAGWCVATRTVSGSHTIEIKYWRDEKGHEARDKERKASSYMTKPQGPVTCEDIGPSTVSRKWGSTIDGTVAKFNHCTFSGGPAAGLQAMVGTSDNLSLVQFFTAEYLAKDSGLRRRVTGVK